MAKPILWNSYFRALDVLHWYGQVPLNPEYNPQRRLHHHYDRGSEVRHTDTRRH